MATSAFGVKRTYQTLPAACLALSAGQEHDSRLATNLLDGLA